MFCFACVVLPCFVLVVQLIDEYGARVDGHCFIFSYCKSLENRSFQLS